MKQRRPERLRTVSSLASFASVNVAGMVLLRKMSLLSHVRGSGGVCCPILLAARPERAAAHSM